MAGAVLGSALIAVHVGPAPQPLAIANPFSEPITTFPLTPICMSLQADISAKHERVRSEEPPRVLDLFSGCGGFSLGFQSAGFEIVGNLEKDPTAARTHARNFFDSTDPEDPHAIARDATEVEPDCLVSELGLDERGLTGAIDVILAGPPCQSYARVGRAKLREIADNPDAFLHDRRGRLYTRMVRFVERLQPLVVVFENVPDVLNQAGENVVEEICSDLEQLSYVCRYTTLNAAHYSVPQMRERVFLIAYHESLGTVPSFPSPTHWIDLPEGYRDARNAALGPLRNLQIQEGGRARYVPAPEPAPDLPPAFTARQALRDLPVYTDEMKAAIRPGPRRFDQELRYRRGAPSTFASLMKRWPGFESDRVIRDHVIRRLPRDYPIFQRMEPGHQYPDAHRIAMDLWRERLSTLDLSELDADPSSPRHDQYEAEKASVVPPYDPGKFVDKWRKMAADEPARTLTAHLGKDSYTHIHYDDAQGRTISVREAARLQSFPDGFQFEGAMNAAFRQIGNAVPPLLARALALHIADEIGAATIDSFCERPTMALPFHSGDGSSHAHVAEPTGNQDIAS